MNQIFVWTFGDVAGLVLLGLVLIVVIAVIGWEAIKYAAKKVRGWFKRTA